MKISSIRISYERTMSESIVSERMIIMNSKRAESVFWGGAFIMTAVALLLNRLSLFEAFGDYSIWRLLLAVLVLAYGIKSFFHWRATGVCFSLAIVGILYSGLLGIEVHSPWSILAAALLLSIGLSIFLKEPRKKYYYKKYKKKYSYLKKTFGDDSNKIYDYSSPVFINQEELLSDTVSVSTKFDCNVKYITLENLKNVNLSCEFGEMKVYFDNAVIPSKIADIWVDMTFAGVELYVPKNWKVVNDVDLSLAGMYEKVRGLGSGDTVLRIFGIASFSSITIIYI